jgi:hypothetical protein
MPDYERLISEFLDYTDRRNLQTIRRGAEILRTMPQRKIKGVMRDLRTAYEFMPDL